MDKVIVIAEIVEGEVMAFATTNTIIGGQIIYGFARIPARQFGNPEANKAEAKTLALKDLANKTAKAIDTSLPA